MITTAGELCPATIESILLATAFAVTVAGVVIARPHMLEDDLAR